MTISYESLVDTLFERMPMGVAIFDREARIVRHNPTWVDFAKSASGHLVEDDLIGMSAYDLFPETRDFADDMARQVFAGETVLLERMQLPGGDSTRYWDVAFSPVYEGDEIVGVIEVVVEVTEREMAQQELEARVLERTERDRSPPGGRRRASTSSSTR